MKTNIVLLALLLLGLVSCADKSERVIQGIPFQETKDGKWSMISMEDGQVLFSEEFKEAPTVAIEGRFMVKSGKSIPPKRNLRKWAKNTFLPRASLKAMP